MSITIKYNDLLSDFPAQIEKRSGIRVRDCYQCGKCTAGCPIAYEMDIRPSQLIRFVQLGAKDIALKSRAIWLCASCETCTTRCPMNVEIAELMNVLREMAIKEGVANCNEKDVTEFSKIFLNSIKKHGRVSELWMINEYKMKRPVTAFKDFNLAFKILAKGKISFLPHNIKGRKAITRIFENCEKAK